MRTRKRVAGLVSEFAVLDETAQEEILEQARWQLFVTERRSGRLLMPFVFLVVSALLLALLPIVWLWLAFPDIHPAVRILGVGVLSGLAGYVATVVHDHWYARTLMPTVRRLLRERAASD